MKCGVLLEFFEWCHLALEGAGIFPTTEYIVAKQGSAVLLPRRGVQYCDIDQLTVPARACVKVDDKVYGISMMQEDEIDVSVQGPQSMHDRLQDQCEISFFDHIHGRNSSHTLSESGHALGCFVLFLVKVTKVHALQSEQEETGCQLHLRMLKKIAGDDPQQQLESRFCSPNSLQRLTHPPHRWVNFRVAC